MPRKPIEYTVFISCPEDVKEEREIVREVCHSLTKSKRNENISVKPLDYKKDVIPVINGKDIQTIINEQIREYGNGDYDIYIGIMWKRYGEKRKDGFSPTEGEFKDALERRKQTGRPEIKFFFKRRGSYPRDSYDALQMFEVQNFKERIQKSEKGFYDEFKDRLDFQKKVYESLDYILNRISKKRPSKSRKKTLISKIKYPPISNYLPRKVIPFEKYTPETFLIREDFSEDLVSVVEKHNQIVLLGDALVGKTTELKQLASVTSRDDSPFYPFLVSLNKYINQSISELLPKDWKRISQEKLLIILDGLDEIESKHKNDAIRQIELFSEQNPNSHILISCRTNFYKTRTEHFSGTLSGFSPYILLDLSNSEIEKYIENQLGS